MTAHRIRVGLAVSFLGLALSAGTASAQVGCSYSCGPQTGEVSPESIQAPQGSQVGAPASVATPAAAPASTTPGSLPFTGGDVAGLAIVGAAAAGAGAILVRRSRKSV